MSSNIHITYFAIVELQVLHSTQYTNFNHLTIRATVHNTLYILRLTALYTTGTIQYFTFTVYCTKWYYYWSLKNNSLYSAQHHTQYSNRHINRYGAHIWGYITSILYTSYIDLQQIVVLPVLHSAVYIYKVIVGVLLQFRVVLKFCSQVGKIVFWVDAI